MVVVGNRDCLACQDLFLFLSSITQPSESNILLFLVHDIHMVDIGKTAMLVCTLYLFLLQFLSPLLYQMLGHFLQNKPASATGKPPVSSSSDKAAARTRGRTKEGGVCTIEKPTCIHSS